ncbi:MAG: protein phosphatase CheZ [Alphaproteobacteria bacterium]|nr:protein phosphatase CheZ [Alphaproteobacteria bacterium]
MPTRLEMGSAGRLGDAGRSMRRAPSAAVAAGLATVAQPVAVSRDELRSLVEAVIGSLEGDLTGSDLKLYTELEALARFIQTAKQEIAAVRPDTIRTEDIPAAADELDAVVGATEEATNLIMDTCEQLQALAGGLDEQARTQIESACIRIFEACNFQDITGQRISKVVRTLKHIEERVAAMLDAFGDEIARLQAQQPTAPASVPPVKSANADSALLHGPQLPEDAKRQDEIDAILASFG